MAPDLAQFHAAAARAKDALEAAVDRLHINNMNGEEDEYIGIADAALIALNALPINAEAAAAHVWPEDVQRAIDAALDPEEDDDAEV